MALFDPTFLLGIFVLLYLSSFIVFAVLRVTTGISIQRIGYFSLRRLAYTPKDGVRIELRGLGCVLHRPTFAQPTWISVVLTELRIIVDAKAFSGDQDADTALKENGLGHRADGPYCLLQPKSQIKRSSKRDVSAKPGRSQTWDRLTDVKEKIKRLHRKINWLRMVDVVATNSICEVVDIGHVQVGSFTMVVDTRRKVVDRGRLFQHRKPLPKDQRPAEWMFTIRSVLFTQEGKDSLEILDHCTLDIHGLLYKELNGLRDASVALKLGRVHIPYDQFAVCANHFGHCLSMYEKPEEKPAIAEISLTDIMEELDMPGSREEKIVQTVSDSKEFVSSILRGIQEVQFAVSFLGFSKKINSVQPAGSPLYLHLAMKEVGVDLHRLDQKSPAHRMYFAPQDVAHQALLAAMSISISIDGGHGKPERLIYVPMVTTTVKTTLPSKTVQLAEDIDAAERNANILFANVVVTSPSVDLDPKYLPLILALLHRSRKPASKLPGRNHHLISRLLPKANIKLSVHEPVVRVTLPPVECDREGTDDFDLLISSISSMALDLESSHSAVGELHYSLSTNFRVSSHQLYYQTASGAKHNLLLTETLEVKVQLNASPELRMVTTANLQTFSVHLVRPEISEAVRQIVGQLNNDVTPDKMDPPLASSTPNILRKMPPWLLHCQFQGSDFSVEIAGIDSDISNNTRGFAFQLESWTAEYKAQKEDTPGKGPSSRRSSSRSMLPDENMLRMAASTPSRKKQQDPTDSRRLALHIHGLEGFIVESLTSWEPEPFLSLPRCEVALSTATDGQGPVFHVNSHIKTLFFQYSLYRHYAIGVATMVLQKAFLRQERDPVLHKETFQRASRLSPPTLESAEVLESSRPQKELITIDIKASLIQIKATMPADPPMMLHICGLDAGRHRWTSPFMKASLVRIYAEAPKMKRVWARIVSIKNYRIDLRASKRKQGDGFVEENSIDVSTEFIRLAVPHQLIMHRVFDNLVNTSKAVQQLHHRFRTGTNDYVLEKHPEGPKKVPRMSIRIKALLFELEDGPFEWKLGLIYRVGLTEQKQRLAREDAFNAKIKKLEELDQRRGSSRYRTHSTNPLPRGRTLDNDTQPRSKSHGHREEQRSLSGSGHRGRKIRYNPDGECSLTGSAKVSIKDAWYKIQVHNAQSWKKRIDFSIHYQSKAMRDIRHIFWGLDELPNELKLEESETILGIPGRPGLMATLISDLHIVVDKPSFPLKDYPNFLHNVGKGMPYDMKYTLLIPMGIQIDMGEARVSLRDYPLPLLHVPAIRPNQSRRLPSWSLKTDFVIAEEYRDFQSTRHIKVDIVPPEKFDPGSNRRGFAIDVRRTVSPVKTYSDVDIAINTGFATRITWGSSYQPVIQDMMQIIEGFTKPPVDPSDRTGFWDKIRLSAHSRVHVAWNGDGDVHLMLKGSRDPYIVTGNGAGFVMCWRNDVRWSICQDEDPKKFMTVNSGEYILAIPDYSHQARQSNGPSGQDTDSVSSVSNTTSGALFKKVVMKVSGNVRWLAGLVFERDVDGGGRSFEFKPHYEVVLKNPDHAKAPKGKDYDAFRGFRSHHIHLSVAVVAPLDRNWSVKNLRPSTSYNSVHLTPRFFTHFFSWWSMFSGVMSLPIRQGSLWPGIEKSSKKFGRHLATIKYNLLLSPLFISHIYKHKDAEDYKEDLVSATGLKVRLDSFMLDLHQRREEFATSQVKSLKKHSKSSGMRINQAQLDFISADIRAVSASIAGTTTEDLQRASEETLASYQQGVPSVDMAKFTIPDNDFSWIDMDDFVELDWILPAESNPETKIIPLAFAPRFTYFRQTDHQVSTSGDPHRSSAFGNEPTHYCVMSQDNDPRRVQCDLIKGRLDRLKQQMENHRRSKGEHELKVIRSDPSDESTREQMDELHQHGDVLRTKKEFLQAMLRRMSQRLESNNHSAVPENLGSDENSDSNDFNNDQDTEGLDDAPLADFVSDFNNRFIVHNMQMKWNNSLRNIILRYIHQVSQRRGFVYYMSRRAVKFILDIVDEQGKASKQAATPAPRNTGSSGPPPGLPTDDPDSELSVEDRIQQLLQDSKKFVDANDPSPSGNEHKAVTEDLGENIAREFTPQNSYHVRLIAPQIQLQSEKNSKAAVLVTAKGMQLKVIQIMDKDRVADDVSGLVQRRFSADMDSVQFFVTNQETFSTKFLHLYSGNRYGTPAGSSWPPWVPMEVMFDFKLNPFGFSRVVQKTSASLRYDKYNSLRLKYNDEVTGGEQGETQTPDNIESRIDHLWVEFPHIRAICDSSQYYAMYLIVLDLLLYSEPLEKVRSERLEKIMLASDFSDLRGAPEMVIRLQDRIRQLEEIKMHFQINAKFLDRQGWEDRLAIEQDLTGCEDELFFIMKAITTSQRKIDDRSQNHGLLRWYLSSSEIVWHLMRDKNEPLMEFQLKNAVYDRTDNSDGSNYNSMHIDKIRGLNLLPDAIYPEMIAPYLDDTKPFEEGYDTKMLRVYWYMLEAIAGIPVLDHFEVNLFPLKVQLEREVGKKLFEYIFPGVGSNAFENGGFSPLMVQQMQPMADDDEMPEHDEQPDLVSIHQPNGNDSSNRHVSQTKPGSLEFRLKPTMHSGEPASVKSKHLHGRGNNGGESYRRFLKRPDRPRSTSRPASIRVPNKKSSTDSLKMIKRSANDQSSTNISSISLGGGSEKPKRFVLHRSLSKDQTHMDEKKKPSDDLTQMMSRASNFMTLAYVKIPSVVLCLSYKGRGERNIEDVHDFVFRMPILEYRNKTWSNLDLALRLKKDVIKALISHTGAIIGNKLSHHRPTKQQQTRLREIANVSMLLPSNDNLQQDVAPGSTRDHSPSNERSSSPRQSFTASKSDILSRSDSYESSPRSSTTRGSMFVSEVHSRSEISVVQGSEEVLNRS
ncbi:MAG: hypothetical protein M1827_001447 [Pycnora praestabilis]|nr:MAG: hypothetical protein M1827_001447 [Pycnora praestabilis]